MSKQKDNIILVVILTISSIAIYFIQYHVFNRASETLFYLFQDLAFIPIQVLIVTLIINRFINILEKRKKQKKINVIISSFFIDAGINILMTLSQFNQNHNKVCGIIRIDEMLSNKESVVKKEVNEFKYHFYADPNKLEELDIIMTENKGLLLNLLGNSNLLEHDSFTDMLWAVFHVGDELRARGDVQKLAQLDIDHLSIDLLRAYSAMIMEWISYIIYLRDEYPFLYAAAIKKNPFCPIMTQDSL